jgi:curved DNA-binding protein CbpA
MDYYELLGVAKDASPEVIKKEYYKLAMKHHPDKYKGDAVEENENHFKALSEAYQILSDPSLRDHYDRHGKENKLQPESGFADPEKLFKELFGGDLFVDIIGELSISRDFGDAMSHMSKNDGNSSPNMSEMSTLTPEEREKKRTERVNRLAKNLLHKIAFFVDHPALKDAQPENRKLAEQEFVQRIKSESEDLKHASYGVELLHAIGFMYGLKARQWIGKEDSFLGIGKVWNDFRERGHVISETFGTIKSAVELQTALSKLQASEEAQQQQQQVEGSPEAKKPKKPLTEEEKTYWEELAAKKGMDTLWKGSKMEVEGIIRDVCDLVLSGVELSEPTAEPNKTVAPKDVLRKRAQALLVISRIYEEVKADPNDVGQRRFQ